MAEILTMAFYAEGTTDFRFLIPIIRRTVEEIILDSDYEIDIYPIEEIKKIKGESFNEEIHKVAKKTEENQIKCLFLHCDADSNSKDQVMKNKIIPALKTIKSQKIIPIIPVYMTEAWMLADLELLKDEINANNISNQDLGFNKQAEKYSNPKEIISNAILKAQSSKSRRKRNLSIAELYSPLGHKISLEKLKNLQSYKDFYNNLKDTCLPYC
jgi:hypothetical protein